MAKRDYQREVRSIARGAWAGSIWYSEFFRLMQATIEKRLTEAWLEGMRQCGFRSLDEMTDIERIKQRQTIIMEVGWIGALWQFCYENRKAQGGSVKPILARADLWGNRWQDVKNQAQQLTCKDKKLRWDIGKTEEHCIDCSAYNGKVYRDSLWRKVLARPQSRSLACCGFQCDCKFTVTDERATGGTPRRMSGCGSNLKGEWPGGPFNVSKKAKKKGKKK